MPFNKSETALVVIDPQNDVLSEKGAPRKVSSKSFGSALVSSAASMNHDVATPVRSQSSS